jgi:hypothetical protein
MLEKFLLTQWNNAANVANRIVNTVNDTIRSQMVRTAWPIGARQALPRALFILEMSLIIP